MKLEFILTYFVVFNVIGCLINIADKWLAKHDKLRIRESTLWSVAILGGAPLSYITMKLIRHKTRHKSFMIGMPILAIVDIVVLIYSLLYLI